MGWGPLGNTETTQQIGNVNDRVQVHTTSCTFPSCASPQLKRIRNIIAKESFFKKHVWACVPVHVFTGSKGRTQPKARGNSKGSESFPMNHPELLQSFLQWSLIRYFRVYKWVLLLNHLLLFLYTSEFSWKINLFLILEYVEHFYNKFTICNYFPD